MDDWCLYFIAKAPAGLQYSIHIMISYYTVTKHAFVIFLLYLLGSEFYL